jgi:hypothetical protein
MREQVQKGWRLYVLCSILALAWLLPTRSFAQPNEARRAAQRARGFALAGQCDLAVPSYDIAIQLSPSNPELRRERGACYDKLGNRAAAANDYRAYCEASPGAADVPAVRQRIAELEAPAAVPPQGVPAAGPVANAPQAGGGEYYTPPVIPPGPAPVYRPHAQSEQAEVSTEDKVRFRGGISAAAGGLFSSVISGFQAGFDGRIGVQINNLIGVYAQPHLVFGPVGVAGVSSVIGVLSGTGLVDITLADHFFLGAGGGFGIVNNPYGPVAHFRLGGYPLMGRGESAGRRKGLLLGADVRLYFLSGQTGQTGPTSSTSATTLTVTEITGAIGYEAF